MTTSPTIVLNGPLSSFGGSPKPFRDVCLNLDGIASAVDDLRAELVSLDIHESVSPITVERAIDALAILGRVQTLAGTLDTHRHRMNDAIDEVVVQRLAARDRIRSILGDSEA
jgi:hypothetical protein